MFYEGESGLVRDLDYIWTRRDAVRPVLWGCSLFFFFLNQVLNIIRAKLPYIFSPHLTLVDPTGLQSETFRAFATMKIIHLSLGLSLDYLCACLNHEFRSTH